jgi:secondary thiamine-phosphate synthase enzyme
MKVFNSKVSVLLEEGVDIKDVTYDFSRLLDKSNISNGILSATVVGSTASITTIEFERGVISDLKRAINKLASPNDFYDHEKAWHDGNGHSHVQAALLGPSISISVRNSKLTLGTWQQVVVINHDNRKRERIIEVAIIGE